MQLLLMQLLLMQLLLMQKQQVLKQLAAMLLYCHLVLLTIAALLMQAQCQSHHKNYTRNITHNIGTLE